MANLEKMEEEITQIKTALVGLNGEGGLLQRFAEHCEDSSKKWEDYYNFKRRVFLIAGTLIGLGVLGGGTYGIIQVVA